MVREEVVEVSDVESYELDFDIGPADEAISPGGTSEYYYSMDLSPDERRMIFHVFKPKSGGSRLAIWDVVRKDVLGIIPMAAFIGKIEFMPNEEKIIVLCSKKNIFGNEIRILNVSGEIIKRIDFPYKTDTGVTAYEDINNFTVNPNSRYIALKMGPVIRIIDINDDKVVNEIRKSDVDRSIEFTSYRLFWPREDGLVATTYKPPMEYTSHDIFAEYRRYPMKYATMINPYTKEVLHKVPIRYTSRITYEDAYFVSPDGEYVAIVNKYLYLPRFSDFDDHGKYLGDGDKWCAVKKYRTKVTHVGWNPNSTELIYDYRNGFVTYDYVRGEVTRRIVVDRIKRMKTWRIFWLRDNTIYFVLDNFPTVVGMLKL